MEKKTDDVEMKVNSQLVEIAESFRNKKLTQYQ